MKQITHKDGSLTIVMRELTGADAMDNPMLVRALALSIATPLGKVNAEGDIDLPSRIWGRVGHVIEIIQQTVSFEGQESFEIPSVDAPAEDTLAFYNLLMELPGWYVTFFKAALKKVNAKPVPNPDGAPTEKPSGTAPQSDSNLAAD